MTKKLNKLQKSSTITAKAKAIQWCYVNTENEFQFMNQVFVIDENVQEYKVHNKAGTTDDYTNEAYMEEILVVLDNENDLTYYNQNYDIVETKYIKTKVEE